VFDNEVSFDFFLNRDTPEVVATELINEIKLDRKYFPQVRDMI